MDGSPAVRLGRGSFPSLSPDGKWVAALDNSSPQQLQLLPTGAGQQRQLTHDPLEHIDVRWTPDGKALVFDASEPNHAPRTYWMNLDEGKARPITPEGTPGTQVSPDGKFVLTFDGQNKRWLYPLAGGDPQAVSAAIKDSEAILSWEPDGKSLLVGERASPFKVSRVYLNSTRRDEVLTLSPSDAAGIVTLAGTCFSADHKSYAYSYYRILSDLYVVDGLR